MRYADYAMGTVVSFDIRPGRCTRSQVSRALRRACAELRRADEVFSTWKPDSPMSRLRRDEITLAQAPPEVAEVLWLCADARRLSGGWFDPWAMPGGVDPTGLVRGWATAGALAVMRRTGIAAALIDAGGDVAAFGTPEPGWPWRIAVRYPGSSSARPACVVEGVGAVATATAHEHASHEPGPDDDTSGDIGDTGRTSALAKPRAVRSATVTGPDLALAGALATAVLAAGTDGPALVDAVPGYGAMVMDPQGVVWVTAGFPPAVFHGQRPVGVAA